MTAGRCAGCGYTNSSCKTVRAHVLSCPEYRKVWQTDRARALDPEAEWTRWTQEEGSPEAKEAERDRTREWWREVNQRVSAQQESRWEPQDILE